MNVLLAGKYVPTGARPIGGVQSWIKTMATGLQRVGYDVDIWGPEFPVPQKRYAFGVMANYGDTRRAFHLLDFALVLSHGIIAPEKPEGGDLYAFTSEGVRDYWGEAGPVLRQPIDLDFWRPGATSKPTLVRYSYRGGMGWVKGVAERLGMDYVHLRNATHEQARDVLQQAACVVATGRAALEAMACGAPVVIADHRAAYQGPLMDPNTFGAMARNYSGRGGIEPTAQNMEEQIVKAMQHGSMRHHVEQHHNVDNIVQQVLACL